VRRLFLLGLLIASVLDGGAPARAADLVPTYKARPPAAVVPLGPSWSGWYVGGNLGYGWGVSTDPSLSFTDGIGAGLPAFFAAGGNAFPSLKPSGVLGGGQLGYNFQTGPWVWGVVTDFQGADLRASQTVSTTVPPTTSATDQTLSAKISWFGTARAKVGWAWSDSWLLYGTGGLAYGRVSSDLNFACTPGGAQCGGLLVTGSEQATKVGWTAGAGVDYALNRNLSLGLEYLYLDLGRDTVTGVQQGLPALTVSIDQHFAAHVLRGTLNWRFAQ